MSRCLVIDRDRDAVQELGLQCLEQGIGVLLADSVGDGVRVLLDHEVTLIAVEADLLRLSPHEQARLFERVAPGVPVVVGARTELALERRVGLELAGFRVLPRPLVVEDLQKVLEGRRAR
jgi:DNA-binding response OmpR family regulator